MTNKKLIMQRVGLVAGCIVLSVVAMLIWGRLKLVAGVPRTALADPEAKKAQQSEAAAPADVESAPR